MKIAIDNDSNNVGYELKSNNSNRSIFLIGTNNPQNSRKLVSSFDSSQDEIFIFPGQRLEVFLPGPNHYSLCSYTLIATGCVDSLHAPNYSHYSNYKLVLYPHNSKILQDLTSEFDLLTQDEEALKLIWFGDIDEDKKIDFLFRIGMNSAARFTLMLSTKADKDKYVKSAAFRISASCY